MATNETRFRVRYVETDQMGMTHHTSYIAWFEVARTEYMREGGFPYRQMEGMGVGLPVVECTCRYLRTTRYDDIVTIRTTMRELTRARVAFDYEVWLMPDPSAAPSPGEADIGGQESVPQKVAEGHTVHAFVNQDGKPIHLGRQSEVWRRLSLLAPNEEPGQDGPAAKSSDG
ncbi:MAG: acyl-CoA thioesterase [Bacteroidetes bacterium]|nr:acyl-CoA thioesterase [Bacteroidota bacterium]MCL5027349.1 acyl-CoA thioesterase [Chloroflexota bacterium]